MSTTTAAAAAAAAATDVAALCAVCQIPAKQLCSACKLTHYCGAEHQRQHWKKHKTECRSFRIDNDPELGRHLVATRDISAGNIIFTELPLIVGPKWYLTEREEKTPVMPCVGCFTPCRMRGEQCPRCHWPACSANCAGLENPNLHALECQILMLGPGPTNYNDNSSLIDYYRSDALVVLKCLCLQRLNPKKWLEFMDMQSHEIERLGSELHSEAEQRIVSYLLQNFLHKLKLIQQKSKEQYLKSYDVDILHRICGIIETNYMCISLPTGIELSGVYYQACMMEHACRPNCYFNFDHHNGFKISVIAGRKIEKGEHLIIMYSNMLWGTQMRQEHLTITKHFLCKCLRCQDPTEFGTNFSSLLCVGDVNKQCGSVQLPKDPLNLKTDWICTKCPVVISAEEVRYVLTQMTDEVDNLLACKPSIKQLETLIEKLSKFLHPNHYHMFNLKHSLIQAYGKEIGYTMDKLTDAQLNKKMQMCDELYEICQKLDPDTIRLSIYVGIILYEKQTVLVERGKRLLAVPNKSEADKQHGLDEYKLAKTHLEQALKILEKELDNVAGSKLSDAVVKAKFQLDLLTNN